MSKALFFHVVTWVWLALPTAAIAGDVEAPADFAGLASRCAPGVNVQTLASLVGHESRFQPFVIGVNVHPRVTYNLKTADAAIAKANELLATGVSLDLGLGQIWSRNLGALGMSVADAFDPCRNVGAAAQLLTDAYVGARRQGMAEQAALDAALSTYNTGDDHAGVANGYVAAVRAQSRRSAEVVPSIAQVPSPPAPAAPPAGWDLFGDIGQISVTEPSQPTSPPPPPAAHAAPSASGPASTGPVILLSAKDDHQ